jgi:hypothetical protein
MIWEVPWNGSWKGDLEHLQQYHLKSSPDFRFRSPPANFEGQRILSISSKIKLLYLLLLNGTCMPAKHEKRKKQRKNTGPHDALARGLDRPHAEKMSATHRENTTEVKWGPHTTRI